MGDVQVVVLLAEDDEVPECWASQRKLVCLANICSPDRLVPRETSMVAVNQVSWYVEEEVLSTTLVVYDKLKTWVRVKRLATRNPMLD